MLCAYRHFLSGHVRHLIHNHLFVKDSEESVIAQPGTLLGMRAGVGCVPH